MRKKNYIIAYFFHNKYFLKECKLYQEKNINYKMHYIDQYKLNLIESINFQFLLGF